MNDDGLTERIEHLETARVLQGMLTPVMLLLLEYGGPVTIAAELIKVSSMAI